MNTEISRDTTTVIQHFMVEELGLSGTALIIYAIIYSYTKNNAEYWGTRDYLARRAGCSTVAVDNALRKLEKMGLINERQKPYERNVYRALNVGS